LYTAGSARPANTSPTFVRTRVNKDFFDIVGRDFLHPAPRSIVKIIHAPDAALRSTGDPVLGVVRQSTVSEDVKFPAASLGGSIDPIRRPCEKE